MIIDSHVHLKHGDAERTEYAPDEIVRVMDAVGIDKSVVFAMSTTTARSVEMAEAAVARFPDRLIPYGKVETIGEAVDLIRQNGRPAGIGAHKLETVKACVQAGIRPDFWVKTLHQTNYWSARPNENYNDNIWCVDPQETIDFMNGLEEPWIAFKILAAGAIHPNNGFKFAFENGADFICVGMYDFQVVEDVNITLDVLVSDLKRSRP